jgi:hypothetical protein
MICACFGLLEWYSMSLSRFVWHYGVIVCLSYCGGSLCIALNSIIAMHYTPYNQHGTHIVVKTRTPLKSTENGLFVVKTRAFFHRDTRISLHCFPTPRFAKSMQKRTSPFFRLRGSMMIDRCSCMTRVGFFFLAVYSAHSVARKRRRNENRAIMTSNLLQKRESNSWLTFIVFEPFDSNMLSHSVSALNFVFYHLKQGSYLVSSVQGS